MAGRPQHQPTAELRAKVTAMAVAGCSQQLISDIIGINRDTLRKHYREELDSALGELQALAGASLVRLIKQGSFPATAMVLKRFNPAWQETKNLNVNVKSIHQMNETELVDLLGGEEAAAALLEARRQKQMH